MVSNGAGADGVARPAQQTAAESIYIQPFLLLLFLLLWSSVNWRETWDAMDML